MTSTGGAWMTHHERVLHASPWLRLTEIDVEAPSRQFHPGYLAIRATYPGAAGLVTNQTGDVLLLWRHRFIPDTWGWELPAGGVHPGEHPLTAAVREVREETGWTVRDARIVWALNRLPERSDHTGYLIHAHADQQLGQPDVDEATALRWWPTGQLLGLIDAGEVTDTITATGLLWWLTQPGKEANRGA